LLAGALTPERVPAALDLVLARQPERVRGFRSCPITTPEDACSSLQMLAAA
jgi:hypothetical protein